ncbi:restriction system protein [Krasilnikovia cinnamomea]|uniref:Restriction system protein n=1 Tax=Krasilnikovia cinnamomea TaxID=349313 RepID=A0A4Q7Z7X7_9ACTN|nr:restriction system protein [Krasilnikovia cinnamomea]
MARKRRRRKANDGAVLAAAGGGLLAISVVVQAIRHHPIIAASIALTALAGAGVWGWLRWAAARRMAEHERDVAVTDHMSGAEFEQFVARLLRVSGYRGVSVSGGAGDMGADVIARTPDGRRLVVQCKRFAGNLGSPHVQRFAGTARDIHRADVALLVTTGRPTAQAREVARRCRITLVDRPELARWVSTQVFEC